MDPVRLPSARKEPPIPAGGRGYPRPQSRRESWRSLDGPWEFALDALGRWRVPSEVVFDRSILVPFAPETPKSGIHENGLHVGCWYRREFDPGPVGDDARLLLHFGAVDYEATVWINGVVATRHEGGYTPFSCDITELLIPGQPCRVVVHALDDPSDLAKPRGKQDWHLRPHSIWYPRTTGIWQSVWYELVPTTRIGSLRWSSSLDRWELGIRARIHGADGRALRMGVRLRSRGNVIFDDEYSVQSGEVHRRIALSDPGIDDSRNDLLWSPESPTLLDADIELRDSEGRVLDSIASYTALRSFVVERDQFLLNGRPYPLRLVLDQGYWPDTGMTPPDDAALRRDVELTRAMGFNGARKHQKIEDPRYLYWADRLGLLVWEEMPSAYRFTTLSVERLMQQWLEVLRRDASHPCIVAWVPFNESWGVPNLPGNPAEQHYVRALFHLTKTVDPSRPVLGNDGWESVTTDIIGIHDYDFPAARIARRYGDHERLPRVLARERPGGRALVVDGALESEHPIVLSEFGGITLSEDPLTWGYAICRTAEELESTYGELLEIVRSLEMFSGFCYTQFADTYQEANGLLYADRTPKFPIERIALATRGVPPIECGPGATNQRDEMP
jgi:beta-galactosidase/beta-glucuronidase